MMTGRAESHVARVGALLGALLILMGFASSPAAADITYIYDELGRLRAVIDPSQIDGTAIYSYDAVGNILSITRQPATQVAIIEFMPKRGPIGTTVTIQAHTRRCDQMLEQTGDAGRYDLCHKRAEFNYHHCMSGMGGPRPFPDPWPPLGGRRRF